MTPDPMTVTCTHCGPAAAGRGGVKLTLPSAEPGMRFILVDGRKAGWVVDIWDDGPGHQAWEAHLWAGPGFAPKGHKTVVRKRLADLREDLRVLAEKEPWWTA